MSEIEIPFLYDHHSHFSLYAGLSGSVCLKDEKDKLNALNLLKNLPESRLNIVYGWNSGRYRFDSSELNMLPPVIISNISLHGFVMNSSAEKLLSVQYPDIIANYHDSKWCENHVTELILFFSKILPLTIETVRNYSDFLLKTHGIYEIDDMLLPSQEVFDLINDSELKNRVHFWADIETFRQLPEKTQKTIKGIKLFTDGANGASTAALSVPYRNGITGLLTHSDVELIELLEESFEISNAVAIHALGDLATDQTVKAVENIKKRGFSLDIRIEHAQFISEKCAKKAKDLGITMSLQPNFSEDSVIYADRIPQEFLKLNNNFRMLIDKAGFIPGLDMIFGSDGMPHGVQFALKQSLYPSFESQKLTIEEFKKGYCTSPVHGMINTII
ncbi:MAG TPA: amidohydrolase family protein [bacterium]|nr:amidohydrolase family protein [bacterium]HPS29237.1 amidohydrolase family protein [bacterium]